MKIKLMRILVCMLLILPIFSSTTVADPGSELKIHIVGSLPLPYYSIVVGGVIANIGDTPAYNISYKMTIRGGIRNTIDETNEGYEKEILPGNALGIGIANTYGFGPVVITVTASSSNTETATATAKGFQIGGFTWIPLSWLFLLFNG